MDSDPPPRTAASTSFNNESPAAEPGEDPFSTDPLQATGSTLMGALIALLALALPIASVLSDRHAPGAAVGGIEPVSLPATMGDGPRLQGDIGGPGNAKAGAVPPRQP
jgi:hypothetical protein